MTSTPIRTTLQRFTDAANARGRDKTRLIHTHRHYLDTPHRDSGGDFYAPVMSAVRRGLLAGDVETHLADLLDRCRPGQREHFTQVADGMLQLIRREHVDTVVPAPRGRWAYQDLHVNVTGMLGVQLDSGERQAWLLHKKAIPLDERAADVPLYIADALLATRRSPLRARVVDVRRATVLEITGPDDRDDLRHLVEAEAAAYITLWNAAA